VRRQALVHRHPRTPALAAEADTAEGRDLSGQQQQRWAVYVRWPSGRRETIFTAFPDQVATQRCWVIACVPLPQVTVVPGRAR
jgi:hypothetical protein